MGPKTRFCFGLVAMAGLGPTTTITSATLVCSFITRCNSVCAAFRHPALPVYLGDAAQWRELGEVQAMIDYAGGAQPGQVRD
jgi:hypothetical protein